MGFIIVVRRQLVLCLVSMGTMLLGKLKRLTNEPTPLGTFCSAAGLEGVIVSKVTQRGNTQTDARQRKMEGGGARTQIYPHLFKQIGDIELECVPETRAVNTSAVRIRRVHV